MEHLQPDKATASVEATLDQKIISMISDYTVATLLHLVDTEKKLNERNQSENRMTKEKKL